MSTSFLLAPSLCLLLATLPSPSSASWFFRDPRQQNSPHYNERQSGFVLPPGRHPASKEQINNINNNNIVESPVVPEVVAPEVTPAPELFGRCSQRSARDFRSVPGDCSRFQMCSAGMLISLSCPEGSVYHGASSSCVPRGSVYDTCTENGFTPESHEICPRGATFKKAHPKECALYYHCGHPAREMRWEEHLNECDYPMLFNVDSGRCEHFSMVKCGLRREPYDPCEYKANECGSPHCVPCSVRNPSCRDKPDGLNAWSGREGSPHYVVCAKQRVVYSGMCDQGRGVQLFDPETKTCKVHNAKSEVSRFIY